MKHLKSCLHSFRVFGGYLLALTFLAMCIMLPFGFVSFWSGYLAWPLVLAMVIATLRPEERAALLKWVSSTHKGSSEKDSDAK